MGILKKDSTNGTGNRVLVAAVVLAVAYWCVEAALHFVIFGDEDLVTNLLYPGANELWMRIVITGLIVGTGVYASRRVTERLKNEARLGEYAGKMRSMTEAVMDAVVMIDSDARVIYWNRFAERIFGYTSEEALGASLPSLIVPEKYHKTLVAGFSHFKSTGDGKILGKTVEMTAMRKDGTEFPVEHTISSLWLHGKWHAVGVIRDITERKRAMEELRALSERNAAILSAVPDIIMEVDEKKVYTWANKAGLDFFGPDVVGREASFYFEGAQETYETVAPLFEGSSDTIYVESWQRRHDGQKRLLAWWCRALKHADGSPAGGLSSARDVTDIRGAEEELTRVFNLSPDMICIAGPDGFLKRVNPAWKKTLGYSTEELLSTPFTDFIHPDDRQATMAEVEKQLKGTPTINFENRYRHKDGTYRTLEWKSLPAEGGLLYAAARDITEKKKAEDAIRESEERYRDLVNNVDEIIFSVRIDGDDPLNATLEFVNRQVEGIFGLSPEELKSDPAAWLKSIHPEDLETVQQVTREMIDTGRPVTRLYRIKNRRSGQWRWIEEKLVPQLGPDNRVVAFKGASRDVTDSMLAEQRIRLEAETTRGLLRLSAATAATTDVDRLVGNVVKSVKRILDSDMTMAYLWDAESGCFRPAATEGLSHDALPFFRTESIKRDTALVGECIETGKNVVVNVDERAGGAPGGWPWDDGLYRWIDDLHTLVFIPLKGRRVYLGLLVCAYLKTNPKAATGLGKREQDLSRGIGHQVSTALEEARLYKDSLDKTMELSHNIETIRTMHEIDRSILSSLDSHTILDTAVTMVGRLVSCDAATVLLRDKASGDFICTASYGLNAGAKVRGSAEKNPNAEEVLRSLRPLYIPGESAGAPGAEASGFNIEEGFMSRLVVPLIIKGEGTGVISICAKRPSAFTPGDLSTVEKLSAQIGVALENSRLVGDLEELLIGTIRTLSETIDAKSTWTRGHSDRVTSIALEIASEMHLSDSDKNDLEIAGFLHDIGKIGTNETILNRPGRLAEEELEEVKKHPKRGAEMLAPIKPLERIIPAIRHHHEFYNGKGYPDGLKGEEIPLLARILAVADTVDAMSADRPYRSGLGTEAVLDELKRCSGTQFDPDVVKAYFKIRHGQARAI